MAKNQPFKKSAASSKKNKAIFFDRDGVLIVDKGYAFKPETIEFNIGLVACLNKAKNLGYLLFILTNQSGVARGFFSLYDVYHFHQTLQFKILESGGPVFDGVYVCPHYSEGLNKDFVKFCDCRKPGTALVEQAKHSYDLNLNESFLIGDKDSDMQCAENAGLTGVLFGSNPKGRRGTSTQQISQLSELTDILK
ncbi:MAG: HAD family hydrolase [Oligoflexales bacterium]|nr:HAD family hydrolase [Oligoflexales bacterium]